jgi:hypothetical protein
MEIGKRVVLDLYFEHPMGTYAARNAAEHPGAAWPRLRRVEDL